MPIFVVPLLALALGGAGALLVEGAGAERRKYTVMRERAARIVGLVALLILAPNAAYFFCRWPDWSVAYLFQASRLPSAVTLLVAFVAASLAGVGFRVGLALVRDERRRTLVVSIGALMGAAVLVVALLGSRLWLTGTFDDYKHPEEMKTLSGSWLGLAVVTIDALTVVGVWLGLAAPVSRPRAPRDRAPRETPRAASPSPFGRGGAAMPKLRGSDLGRR